MKRSSSPFSVRLHALRERASLSAFALSQAAGLGVNTVRQLERGLRKPQPATIDALARALSLSQDERGELRKLAGIDVPVGDLPGAKAARRSAWPLLTYTVVNDVLLPFGQLEDTEVKLRECGHVLRSAAEAPGPSDFAPSVQPNAQLLSLLHAWFGGVGSSDLKVATLIAGVRLMSASQRFDDGPAKIDPHTVGLESRLLLLAPLATDVKTPDDRVLTRLRPLRSQTGAAPTARDPHRLLDYDIDRHFALAVFPFIYWHACRWWPVGKLQLPLPRRPAATACIHAAVRAGLSLEELDLALLGEGERGQALLACAELRPPLESRGDGTATYVFDDVVPHTFTGPIAPHDQVFDHADRAEFLDRFPLLRLDRVRALELANRLSLPSWSRWLTYLSELVRRPWLEESPPFGSSKARDVLGSPITHRRLGGLFAERLREAFGQRAVTLLMRTRNETSPDGYRRLLEAAESLDTGDMLDRWKRLFQSLAQTGNQTGDQTAPDRPAEPQP